MNTQEWFDSYTKKKEAVKQVHEELREMEEAFLSTHEEGLEYPIQVDGKDKFIRIEAASGQYVYNKKYEIGVRATPKHPA